MQLTQGQRLAAAKRLAERNILMLKSIIMELNEMGLGEQDIERELPGIIGAAQKILTRYPLGFIKAEGRA